MDIKELMGRVVEELYAGITGGSAELPLPPGTTINWLLPGLPMHESAFDFAIAGPFSGPSPATLEEFRRMVAAIQADAEANGGQPMDRALAVEEAKRMYQQHLLGSWEQWSRLVDFIPLIDPTPAQMSWSRRAGQGSKKHVGVVYGQAGQTLSNVYRDTLQRCEVADEQITAEQQKLIDRMKALLQVEVEVEDFLTGEKVKEIRESPAMVQYKAKKIAYENAVTDYAARLARSTSGTPADLIEWNRSGGIYRQRALQALADWQSSGAKNAIETAQATIAHITGGSMVQWKQRLLDCLTDIDQSTQGAFGYPFFPATVLPGAFARSPGWTRFSQRNVARSSTSTSSTHSGGGSVGFSLGIFSIGAAGGATRTEHDFKFQSSDFGIEFEYTQVEIVRPAFNPNFFLSRGWKPRDTFVRDYNTSTHSTGGDKPTGCLIGYPTKALFVRNLRIHSTEFASHMHSLQSEVDGGGVVGIGPFVLGGRYSQTNRSSESNLSIDTAGITVNGLQLVAFISALFPACSNPSPDVTKWI